VSDDREAELWVRSTVSPEGAYILTVEYGDDVAFHLDDAAAVRYAQYVLTVVARAEYDAAVIDQLTSSGVEMAAVGQAIKDLRGDRAPLVSEWPVSFDGMVASRTLLPQVTIAVNGEKVGQLGTAAAVDHATNVLECHPVAELDAAYRRWLVGSVGLPEQSAGAAIEKIADHRRRT
jgi:hypothetical protein